MIGADTSFLIDYLKDDPKAVKFMEKHKEEICVCETIIFEFLCGNLNKVARKIFLSFMTRFESFDSGRTSILEASDIYRNKKRKGENTGKTDCIIAGTYKANGVSQIVTRNVKHFKNIPGIKILTY